MPRRTHDDLLRTLSRSELAPVYYFFGTEEVLKEEASRSIVDRGLEPHERDFNLDRRSALDLDPEGLHSLVNTLPMMAARRVVVVTEVEAWRRKPSVREVVERYVAQPAADTVLVLIETAPPTDRQRDWEPNDVLVRHAFAVDFQPLPPDRVIRWLGHHAGSAGVTFGEGAAEHLAAATGYDLGALKAELAKLGSLSEAAPITREQVAELVGVRHGETLEDWVEAVVEDDTQRAIRLVRRILEQAGMSGVRMVTALGTALIGLKLARAHYDRGVRGDALQRTLFDRLRQVRPFGLGDWKLVTRSWSRWAASWPADRLRSAIRAALVADTALKGTRISDEAGVITDLVLALAGESRHRSPPAPRGTDPVRRAAATIRE